MYKHNDPNRVQPHGNEYSEICNIRKRQRIARRRNNDENVLFSTGHGLCSRFVLLELHFHALNCPRRVGQICSTLPSSNCLTLQGSIRRPICSHLDHLTLEGIVLSDTALCPLYYLPRRRTLSAAFLVTSTLHQHPNVTVISDNITCIHYLVNCNALK